MIPLTCTTLKNKNVSRVAWCIFFLLVSCCLDAQQRSLPAVLSSANSPAGFIRNIGQVGALEGGPAKHVFFVFTSPAPDVDVLITDSGISYVYKKLQDTQKRQERMATGNASGKEDSSVAYHYQVERIDATLLHAHLDTATIELTYADSNSGMFNYYDGRTEITAQRMIQQVVFKNVYPGIDWVLHAYDKNGVPGLKYDFVIQEGADPKLIHIVYSSNAALQANEQQGVVVNSRMGFVQEGRPVITGTGDSGSWPIAYKIDQNTISYTAEAWPTRYPYTIDPDLYWGTFLHSLVPYDGMHWSEIHASDVTTDHDNNIYVVLICKGSVRFPTFNPGGGAYYNDVYDSTNGSVVYMKFAPSGVLLWSTYFNSGYNYNTRIITDGNGNLIATGGYRPGNLPVKNNGGFSANASTGGVPNTTYLARFDKNGILNWCTPWSYFDNYITDIAIDADNSFYIAGYTNHAALPLKDPGNGAYMNTVSAYGRRLFVSKFDSQCNLVWSTDVLGNNDDDLGTRIAVDSKKNVYLLGKFTRSSNLPLVNAGGYYKTGGIAYLMKFDASHHLVWSTYIPAFGRDVTVDTSGNAYVVGSTTGAFSPVDPGNGAYMDPSTGKYGGYIMKFDSGTNLTWATTYYGLRQSFFNYVVFDEYRNLVHVYGIMNDNDYDVPTQNDACNGSYYHTGAETQTSTDPLLLIFTTGGQRLYASFNAFPYAYYDIAAFTVDHKGNQVYVFGQIQESGPLVQFPALRNPGGGAFYQPGSNNYLSDASFVMKLTPSLINFTTSIQPPAACNCSGSITVIPYCGSGNYQYQWNRGDQTPAISNVCPGTYSVKIKDLSTMSDTTITIILPNPPANINAITLIASPDHCGKGDGLVKVAGITGGPSPYTYALDNGAFGAATLFNHLPAGIYHVKVKDNNGCLVEDSVAIAAVAGPDSLYTSIRATACNTSSGEVTVTGVLGGTFPYTYALGSGAASLINNFPALGADTYVVRVYDSAGCAFTTNVVVPVTKGPSAIHTNVNDTHCDQAIGRITVDGVTGGRAPFRYSLTGSGAFQSVDSFTGLAAGNYTIYLSDANGCGYDTSLSIGNIPGPGQVNFTQLNAICGIATGSIRVQSVTGGIAPYQYSETNTVWSSQPFLQGLIPGAHHFRVKDAYGCVLVDSAVILQTPALQIGVRPGDTLVCSTDQINFNAVVRSSNSGVTFAWNNGASHASSYQNRFIADTVVTLLAIDKDGCMTVDTIAVKVHYCGEMLSNCVIFPNAFTPNGDGKNDLFGAHLSGCEIRAYELSVYNRWGQQVFHTRNPAARWNGGVRDGRLPGTYVYVCKWMDGVDVVRSLKGYVVLML
jgi:gliding motility-associated-like protein